MENHVSRRAGLLLFGLLSLGDIITIFVTDGESPPYAVAAVSAVLGLVSLFLVITALREPARPLGSWSHCASCQPSPACRPS